MDVINYLQTEMDKHLAKAREIADAADKEGRGLSDVERDEAQAELAQVAELKTRITDEVDKKRLRDAVDGFDRLSMTSTSDPNPVREPAVAEKAARSLGEAFITSEGFRLLQAKVKSTGNVPENFHTPAVMFKAAGDPVLESDSTEIFGTGGNAGALTTFLPVQPPLQPRLTIASLLGSVPVTAGNSVTYPVVDTRTAISGTPQTEGAAKAGGEYIFATETEVLVTLAGWVKVSTQFLEDAPGLAAYINADLPYQIRFNEEAYLASALYTGAGLSADGSGLTLSGTPNGFDAIQEAVALIAENNGEADGMIISPFDWANLLVTKFGGSGTETAYVGGGPFSATNNPWGIRVVVTPAATDGLPLVGDFGQAAKVYRRGGLTVSSTNSDQDDFIKNLVTIRAEQREVIGITYANLLSVAVIGTS